MLVLQSAILLFWHVMLLMVAYSLAQLATCLLFGAPVTEFSVFAGRELWSRKYGGVRVVIRSFPLPSAFLRIIGQSPDDPPHPRSWTNLSPLVRKLISSAGTLALVFVAVLCIGPSSAYRELIEGFLALGLGAYAPLSVGKPLVQSFVALERVDFIEATGILAAKNACATLLPFSQTTLWNLLGFPDIRNEGLRGKLEALGLLMFAIFYLSWAVAIVAAISSI